ncbi:MAG TPA: hypothetical protein VJN93_13520 [Candidatus Acidoferrum sp.]|nr:hypothetical protein [Candidatus Acidoferrum sp.]
MEPNTTAVKTRKNLFSKILMTAGLLALMLDLSFLLSPLSQLFASAHSSLIGFVPALGMSFLSAARSIFFHQLDYFSLVSRILVLFCAMVAIISSLVRLLSSSANDSPSADSFLSHDQEAL